MRKDTFLLWRKMVNKMKLVAFARLIHRKINSAHRKAQNPFIDSSFSYNPFSRPIYTTLVWVEPDEDMPNAFKKY